MMHKWFGNRVNILYHNPYFHISTISNGVNLMHHVESLHGPMDLIFIVKEQVLAAEGSVYHHMIQGSLNMQKVVLAGSITMDSLSICL